MVTLRTALLGVMVATVVPFGLLLHLTWWDTASNVSRDLVDALETQITDDVRRSWWSRVIEVQSLSLTVRDALKTAETPEARERILSGAATAFSTLSWLVYVPAAGAAGTTGATSAAGGTVAVRDLGPGRTRLYRVAADGAVLSTSDATRDGAAPATEPTADPRRLAIAGQAWVDQARRETEAGWADVAETPDGAERAIAYVDPAGGAVLAAMLGYDKFASLLGEIPVGRTGRSYVLGPEGAIVIASESTAAPRLGVMDDVALAAGRLIAARPRGDGINVSERTRLTVAGARYAIGLSPLWFEGWQLAVIVPETEFLENIDATIRRVAIGLALFVLVAGIVGSVAAGRLVATPIARVVQDLAHIEQFDLEKIPRRHSRLREIDRLSEALVRMTASLADFGKFIHADLVRGLVADGMRAEPGGSRRDLTVLFADLVGFTNLSERLGDEIVPVVSAYLDLASRIVAEERGTVDKFIGDAIMAFWGAPKSEPDQAFQACRAALAIAAAVVRMPLPPGVDHDLKVRVGVQSGPAVVGNVGSTSRLNYTALGDTVNLAARLEAVNKAYGTTILIGAETRKLAGDRIVVREVDRVSVYGRNEAVTIFELLGLACDTSQPDWASAYEGALAAYRDRRFADSLAALDEVVRLRPQDGPSARLAASARAHLANPPAPDWDGVTVLDLK